VRCRNYFGEVSNTHFVLFVSENQDGLRIINNELSLGNKPWGCISLHLQKLNLRRIVVLVISNTSTRPLLVLLNCCVLALVNHFRQAMWLSLESNLLFPGMLSALLTLDIIGGCYTTVSVGSYTKYITFLWYLGN